MKQLAISILVIVFGFWGINSVSAHGAVTTQTATSGNYNIEFEYSTLGQIQVGDFTTYDVFLLNQNRDPVDFDAAYVKIMDSKGATELMGNLKEATDEEGSARIGGVIHIAGDHKANVQFQKDNKVIASADFDFKVGEPISQSPKKDYKTPAATLLVGFLLGALAAYLIRGK